MSWRIVDEVLDHSPKDLTPGERLVLVVLASHANDQTRICWPGMDNIVRRTGMHEDTIRRAINQLRDHGLLQRRNVAHRGARTEYQISALRSPVRPDETSGRTAGESPDETQGLSPTESPDRTPTLPQESPDESSEKARTNRRQSPDETSAPSVKNQKEPSINQAGNYRDTLARIRQRRTERAEQEQQT